MPKTRISRLPDGRLLRRIEGSFEVLEDGKWVPAKGVTVGAIWESLPLLDSEIDALIEAGILPSPEQSEKKPKPEKS